MPIPFHRHTGGDAGPQIDASDGLQAGSITTDRIGDGQVTNPKVGDGELAYGKMAANTIQLPIYLNLQPEGQATGLVADATGVQKEGYKHFILDLNILKHAKAAYIEVAKASSAGDEVTAIEVYDDTAAAVADSLSVTGATTHTRSVDILASLTAGNEIHVRWNVTTASATTGATFDAQAAFLVIEIGIS